MDFSGMTIDEAVAASKKLRTQAKQITTLSGQIEKLVSGLGSGWLGADSQAFSTRDWPKSRTQMKTLGEAIDGLADVLDKQINEQRLASAVPVWSDSWAPGDTPLHDTASGTGGFGKVTSMESKKAHAQAKAEAEAAEAGLDPASAQGKKSPFQKSTHVGPADYFEDDPRFDTKSGTWDGGEYTDADKNAADKWADIVGKGPSTKIKLGGDSVEGDLGPHTGGGVVGGGGDEDVNWAGHAEWSASVLHGEAGWSAEVTTAGQLKVGGNAEVSSGIAGSAGIEGTWNHVTGGLEGEAFAGARASGTASVDVGAQGLGVDFGFEAFAGAEASATGSLGIDGATANVTASAYAGVGVKADVAVDLSWSHWKADVDLGVALGVGAGIKFSIDIEPLKLADTIKDWFSW